MMQASKRPEAEDSNHLDICRDAIYNGATVCGTEVKPASIESIGEGLSNDILSLSGKEDNDDDRLMQQLQAAKDENELLEFKNYELLFKIQELEQAQSRCNSNNGLAGFHKSSSSSSDPSAQCPSLSHQRTNRPQQRTEANSAGACSSNHLNHNHHRQQQQQRQRRRRNSSDNNDNNPSYLLLGPEVVGSLEKCSRELHNNNNNNATLTSNSDEDGDEDEDLSLAASIELESGEESSLVRCQKSFDRLAVGSRLKSVGKQQRDLEHHEINSYDQCDAVNALDNNNNDDDDDDRVDLIECLVDNDDDDYDGEESESAFVVDASEVSAKVTTTSNLGTDSFGASSLGQSREMQRRVNINRSIGCRRLADSVQSARKVRPKEVSKQLAKSQPNLATNFEQATSHSATKTMVSQQQQRRARIAMPVQQQRNLPVALQQRSQLAATSKQQSHSLSSSSSLISGRARSKSSLDSSSIARNRATSATSASRQTPATKRALPSDKDCSFVTQIPTLISQSHAHQMGLAIHATSGSAKSNAPLRMDASALKSNSERQIEEAVARSSASSIRQQQQQHVTQLHRTAKCRGPMKGLDKIASVVVGRTQTSVQPPSRFGAQAKQSGKTASLASSTKSLTSLFAAHSKERVDWCENELAGNIGEAKGVEPKDASDDKEVCEKEKFTSEEANVVENVGNDYDGADDDRIDGSSSRPLEQSCKSDATDGCNSNGKGEGKGAASSSSSSLAGKSTNEVASEVDSNNNNDAKNATGNLLLAPEKRAVSFADLQSVCVQRSLTDGPVGCADNNEDGEDVDEDDDDEIDDELLELKRGTKEKKPTTELQRSLSELQRDGGCSKSLSAMDAIGRAETHVEGQASSPSITTANYSSTQSLQQQQQQQTHCGQCKLLNAKLSLLLKDRKQLNEQLNELEELENDSRLLSQKLTKKLASLEQQLELANSDLVRACDSESKLRFQNKRLHFELKERCDRITRLQAHLSSLTTSASSSTRQSSSQVKQQLPESASCHDNDDDDSEDRPQPVESDAPRQLSHSESVLVDPSNRASDADESCASSSTGTQVRGDDSAYSKSSSSSSNGDSDIDERAQQTPATSNEGDTSGECSKTSTGNEDADTAANASTTSESQMIAARQQVHRKRISTARILRGNCTGTYANTSEQTGSTNFDPDDDKRALELTLRGVAELESGSSELLRSLGEQKSKDTCNRTGESEQVASEATAEAVAAEKRLVCSLRDEISNLRARLCEAQTLNDNLVGELRNPAKAATTPTAAPNGTGGARKCEATITTTSGATLIGRSSGRRSSVILVNGQPAATSSMEAISASCQTTNSSSCSQTAMRCTINNSSQLNGCAKVQQVWQPRTVLTVSSSASSSNGYVHNNNDPAATSKSIVVDQSPAAQSWRREQLEDVAQFLRSLLDKLHFHHGRTFELASECQRVAISALLVGATCTSLDLPASGSGSCSGQQQHQPARLASLVHHNNAVMAGNKATLQQLVTVDPAQRQRQQCDQLQMQQVQQLQQQCPVRPPPRRRNNGSAMRNGTALTDSAAFVVDCFPPQQSLPQTSNCVLATVSRGGNDSTMTTTASSTPLGMNQIHGWHPILVSNGLNKSTPATGTSGSSSKNNHSNVSVESQQQKQTALQVAKQTLFNLVPIYGSSSSSSNNVHNNVNDCSANSASGKLDGDKNRKLACAQTQSGTIDSPSTRNPILLNGCQTQVQPANSHFDGQVNDVARDVLEILYQQTSSNDQTTAINLPETTYSSSTVDSVHVDVKWRRQPSLHVLPINDRNQQQLQHSLPALQSGEDIERLRVRLNGQLLDLVTRQNWCESLIMDKLRAIEHIINATGTPNVQQSLRNQHQQKWCSSLGESFTNDTNGSLC